MYKIIDDIDKIPLCARPCSLHPSEGWTAGTPLLPSSRHQTLCHSCWSKPPSKGLCQSSKEIYGLVSWNLGSSIKWIRSWFSWTPRKTNGVWSPGTIHKLYVWDFSNLIWKHSNDWDGLCLARSLQIWYAVWSPLWCTVRTCLHEWRLVQIKSPLYTYYKLTSPQTRGHCMHPYKQHLKKIKLRDPNTP